MPLLKFTTFDGVTHTHELMPGITRIGRTPGNDLQIDELAVSSQHCELRYDGRTLTVQDLQSAGGTYVDGQPVTQAVVHPGQLLSLGTVLVKIEESLDQPSRPNQIELKPVQLPDGSYSCLRHHATRALFECENCFDLACHDCARQVTQSDARIETFCKNCGAPMRTLDWSGLDMSKKDALKELFIPKQVQQAVDFWNKHRDKLRFKKE